MKRETLRHPKTFDLAARLNRSRPEVLGFLTLLWDFTADVAPSGNIGKHSDGSISRACDWDGDPSSFIDALVAAGYLDRDPDHRLLIHDWSDHCERWVKLKLEKLGLRFAVASTERSTEPSTDATIGPSPPRDQTYPTQTNPNLPKPNPPVRANAPDIGGLFSAWYAAYPRHIAKDRAAAAYGRALRKIADHRRCEIDQAAAWLLGVTEQFAASQAGRASESAGDLQYVPYPASWLNGGHFNDDQSEWQKVRTNGKSNNGSARVGEGQRYRE